MKIEDAIDNLSDILVVMKTQHMMKDIDGELEAGETQMYRDRFESIHMGIRALEKQIPKPVVAHEQIRDGKTTRIDLECPACGFWQDERHIKSYCPMCGQRIK